MTRNKDLKRIIRTRVKKTGESYTAARAHVISTGKSKQAPARSVNLAELAGMSDDKVAAKTGRTWHAWLRTLDADKADTMSHGDIAAMVHGKHGVDNWWSQMVTVGYERIKGRRERGQRLDGMYEASKSKTFNVPVKTLFRAWADSGMRRRWLDDVKTVVRTATAPKSMRLQWPDGTIVAIWFTPKGETKSVVALAHTKLRDKAASDKAKTYWRDRLDALATLFVTPPIKN
jgi:uncharacterized protein YndB with AHSA1/START domain